jgi:hypothetical protein
MKKRAVQFTILAVSVSLLAGCTSSGPVTSPSPTKTPSSSPSAKPTPSATATADGTATASPTVAPTTKPGPDPVKTTVIEIGADELRIEDIAGNVMNAFPYEGDSTDEAVAALTSLYGKEPTKRYTGDQTCDYQNNVYTWDNLVLRFQASSQNVNDAERFVVTTNGANQNYERVVQAPNGAQVTQSLEKFHKEFPNLAYSIGGEYEGVTYSGMIGEPSQRVGETAGEYQVENITPADANTFGVVISAENDKIGAIYAPGGLIGDC